MTYKTIILSDIHLGSNFSRANEVTEFLRDNQSERLILNGDIIDGWALRMGSSWTEEHMKCVRKIMKLSTNIEVTWLRGNHDDFLKEFIGTSLGSIAIKNEMDYIGLNGKKYLVLHGDIFDVFITEM